MPETYKEMQLRLRKEKRQSLFDKYGGKCSYCGCDLTDSNFQVDHYIPKRRGATSVHHSNYNKVKGSDSIENLYPCCGSCNASKSDLDLEDFRGRVYDRVLRLNQYSTEYNIAKRFGLVQEIDKPVIFHFETFINNG